MVYKKILLIILAACILTGAVYADDKIILHLEDEGLEPPPDITANAAVVINLQNESVIYEKRASDIIPPGPTVKIMTAILAAEYILDPSNDIDFDTKVVVSRNVVNNTVGNNIDMKEGEVFSVEQLMHAILVFNANDACLAIAELISGSVDSFIIKMNEKARELGCESTVYANPHGIHSANMHTTALDTAKIALYASKIDMIMDISSVTRFEIPETNRTASVRNLVNRNHLVSRAQQTRYFYEHARGINSGSTTESGFCLVTTGRQHQNLSYLCVIMGATSALSAALNAEIINSFGDAQNLLEWAFMIYAYRTVVRQKEQISTVKIELAANRDEITLIAEEDIRLLIPQNADIDEEIERVVMIYDDRLFAPIEQGQVLGELSVLYKGEVLGSTRLVATADVEPSNILTVLDHIKNIVARPWFTASVIIFIILSAAYIGISLFFRGRRQRKRFY